jgi:hypothetical protein
MKEITKSQFIPHALSKSLYNLNVTILSATILVFIPDIVTKSPPGKSALNYGRVLKICENSWADRDKVAFWVKVGGISIAYMVTQTKYFFKWKAAVQARLFPYDSAYGGFAGVQCCTTVPYEHTPSRIGKKLWMVWSYTSKLSFFFALNRNTSTDNVDPTTMRQSHGQRL